MGAGVHVLNKNHKLFIVWSEDTDGDGCVSTVGQLLRVFFDVTVGGVCPWLTEGCLGIDILLILNFVPGGVEVMYEVTDGEI